MIAQKKQNLFTKWFEKRPTICGFSVRFLWQDNEFVSGGKTIEYELSFQFLYWYSEIIYFKNKRPTYK